MFNRKSRISCNSDLLNLAIKNQEENFTGNLPETISGTYVYDYDISKINDIIIKKLKYSNEKSINKLKDELENIDLKLTLPRSMNEHKILENQKKQILEDIDKIIKDLDKNTYIDKTKDLIDGYKKEKKKKVSYFGETKVDESTNLYPFIEQFLEIAKNYIDIDVVRKFPSSNCCVDCKSENMEMFSDDECGAYCLDCGYTDASFNVPQNVVVKSEYEDRGNFHKILLRFQGKQKNKIPESLYEDLSEYFPSNLKSEYVLTQPLNSNYSRGKTNIHIMSNALKNLGKSTEDIYLICQNYWGWKLRDLSDYEEQIIYDYDITQEAFKELDNIGRVSSINSNYRLFKHLEGLNIPCDISEFIIPDKIKEYDIIWKKMLDIARKKGCKLIYKKTI